MRGVNFRAALIKIPLHSGGNIVTGFRRLSKPAGVSVSAEGSHGGTFGSVSGPLGVFEHGREEFSSTFKGIFFSSPPVGLNGPPLTVRPAHTSRWGSCVCWWCCSPYCWCRGFPKTSTAPRAPAVLLGCRKLTGASSRLKVLDFGKVSRLGGTPTAGETNATPSSRVSTDNAENIERVVQKIMNSPSKAIFSFPRVAPGQENLGALCSCGMLSNFSVPCAFSTWCSNLS